jgi:hypothetical protein
LRVLTKLTQFRIFGLKSCHLATLFTAMNGSQVTQKSLGTHNQSKHSHHFYLFVTVETNECNLRSVYTKHDFCVVHQKIWSYHTKFGFTYYTKFGRTTKLKRLPIGL